MSLITAGFIVQNALTCAAAAWWLCNSPCGVAAGLFFPEAFLIAVLQSHTLVQSGGVAMDRLALTSVVLSAAPGPSSIDAAPAVGVYVHGLYLEGAR